MPAITASESQVIKAPASILHGIIADHREGHPRILPPQYCGRLDVLAGGHGSGTWIRFEMKAFGRVNIASGEVTEPVPGRELRETLDSGIVTTFLVEPLGPDSSRVTIMTAYVKSGVTGWIERLLAPGYLRKVYRAELTLLAQVVRDLRFDRIRP
jgi:hypothetical protein